MSVRLCRALAGVLSVASLGSSPFSSLGGQSVPRTDSAAPAMPAYRFRLLGVYDEATGEPLEGVQVSDLLNGNSALTTKTGTVSLFFLPDGGGLIRLRKVGYVAQTFTVSISPRDTAPIAITMLRANLLDTVHIRDSAVRHLSPALRGFEERKRTGLGHYVDEAEMRKNDSRTLEEVFTTHFPEIMPVPTPNGGFTISSTRKMCSGTALSACKHPNCYPLVFVDGVKATLGAAVGEPADWSRMSPRDYAAAEFYGSAATAPSEYASGNTECGILLLWTRER